MTNRMNIFGRGQGLDGDTTTTGAICLSSLPQARQSGRGILRQGDVTTACSLCGETGTIIEGESRMQFHGIPVATDGALVLCKCPPGKNRLLAPLGSLAAGGTTASLKTRGNAAPSTSPAKPFTSPSTFMSASSGSLEPGFFIVPRSMPFSGVLLELAEHDSTLPISRLQWLNPTYKEGFKAGEMFVIGDPDSANACTREEAQLMAAAERARRALDVLDFAEADFMVQHQAEIAGLLGDASLSMGVGKDMLDQGLKQVESTLKQIEQLHKQTYLRQGHLNSAEFFASRRQLLKQLDGQLKAAFLNKQLNLGNYERLRKDLNISTKSLVHHWSKAGGPGQIPGYATHLNKVAELGKYLKHGGRAGVVLGGVSSYSDVQEVCRAGETEACKKVRVTEASIFAGGIAGGIAGSNLGGLVAIPICGVVAVVTAGIGGAVCGIVLVGGGSFAGSILGEMGGELMGEEIYEAIND